MDKNRRNFMKTHLVLPVVAPGIALAAPAFAQGCAPQAAPAQPGGPFDVTKAEETSGVKVEDFAYAPGNVRRYGAVGDGANDDTQALQACLDAAQAANFSFPVYLPTGDYVINRPLTIRGASPKSVVMLGDGGAFGIRNSKITVGRSWSGDAMVQSDRTRKNGWTISDIWFDAGGRAKCILNLEEFNHVTVRGCRLADATGTVDRDGVGALTLKNSWVSRVENCVIAACGDGVYCGENTNNVNFWGCSMVLNKGIGLRMRNCYGVNIGGSVFEDNAHCGLLLDVCRGVWINGNYFETNGETGYRFTKGEPRTIRADIIANGYISPQLAASDPCRGIGVFGNYFMPPRDTALDASIYLVAITGFSEDANEVHRAYAKPSAFVKTKSDGRLYRASDVTLGNSWVAGVAEAGGRDRYFDVDGIEQSPPQGYDRESLSSLHVHPRRAPRFDAHADLGFDPAAYEVVADSGVALTISRAGGRHMGRPVYLARSGAPGASSILGGRIAAADYADFWEDGLWLAYVEAQRSGAAAGFELQLRLGQRVLRDAGSLPAGGRFSPRAIVFRPEPGSEIRFGIGVSGAGGTAGVRFTRPVLCPLGAFNDLRGAAVAG